ncbi:MAG TPA: COX15/CtaA family protein [Rhizomicrobium sp.]|jgi:cytochrome c oxidase assembly protein subunit 15|nr:COX15/CtaA family protein [Rhizomicrobium sp.]
MTVVTQSRLWNPGPRAVGLWLLGIALVIACMVTIGGLTRLTGSGLSITQWDPIMGVIPPLSTAAWMDAFHKYQQIPQYILEHQGMSLDAFKGIFWWEWTHRLLGRVLGVVFFVPFAWFAWRGAIKRAQIPRMVVLFLLGGVQGFVGWWMVESGLETRVSVSQYRLALHLGVAIILFGAILWTAFEYLRPKPAVARAAPFANWTLGFAGLVYFQMLLGAIVAGLHAGLVYNTWPSMDGHFFPDAVWFVKPWFLNFFENAGLAQFDHRMVAYTVAIAAVALWLRGRRAKLAGPARTSGDLVLGFTAFQIVLGILTLLNQAPTALAAAHQATAVALFSAALWHGYELRRASLPSP